MACHFNLEPSEFRQSRMEVHLDRDTVAWDERLTGQLILQAGPDGLCLTKVRVAAVDPRRTHLNFDDRPMPHGTSWMEVRMQPRARKELPFRLSIPPDCSAKSAGNLIVELLFSPIVVGLGEDATLSHDKHAYPVGFRVQPPEVFVLLSQLVAGRTGLVVSRIEPVGIGGFTRIRLEPETGNHESLAAIELTLTCTPPRVTGSMVLHPRRGGLERLRRLLDPPKEKGINIDLDLTQLERSLEKLDPHLRPFLGSARDLPIPTDAVPGPVADTLPRPSHTATLDVKALPRPSEAPTDGRD